MARRRAGRPSYWKGYEDGWNHHAQGHRKVRSDAKVMRNKEYAAGYVHGWHDGEGRGQTLKQHQLVAHPPKPASWSRYEMI